jgi:hypothetical protein
MQQKKQQKQGKRREWKDQMKESDRMLKSNVLLEKPQWILGLTLAAEFLLLVVLHVLINTFIRFCKGHLADCFSWSCLTTFYPVLAPVYIFVVIVAIAVAILNVYRFRNAFRSLEAGQIMWGEGDLRNGEQALSARVVLEADGSVGDATWDFNVKKQLLTIKTATEDINNLIIFAGHDWENETETILFTGLDAQGHSVWGKRIN